MSTYFEAVLDLYKSGRPFVSVTIVDSQGSVPQDIGSKMLVTNEGLFFGTVGGGKVEKRAIEECLAMLTGEQAVTQFVSWALDKDIGMTCGGSLKLYFETHNVDVWNIVVFGAGHISCALMDILVKLNCRLTCYDSRQEWLDKLPQASNLTKICLDSLPEAVPNLAPGSFVLLITMGHATDSPILVEIMKTSKFPYLGVIGSKAKRQRLIQDLKAAGINSGYEQFYCPIGLGIGSNHPQEIAVSIAAQLIEQKDLLEKQSAKTSAINARSTETSE
jgi:xanthine dehydrogenase accessory factor